MKTSLMQTVLLRAPVIHCLGVHVRGHSLPEEVVHPHLSQAGDRDGNPLLFQNWNTKQLSWFTKEKRHESSSGSPKTSKSIWASQLHVLGIRGFICPQLLLFPQQLIKHCLTWKNYAVLISKQDEITSVEFSSYSTHKVGRWKIALCFSKT